MTPDQEPDNTIYLSADDYEALLDALDCPPKELPRLKALLQENGFWKNS